MPRYSLISARDGDLLNAEAEFHTRADAELWASTLVAARFRLDTTTCPTFAEMVVETDGCALTEIAPDPVASAAVEILEQLSLHVSENADCREVATSSWASSADAVAEALAAAGHNSVWSPLTGPSSNLSFHKCGRTPEQFHQPG